MAGYLSVQSLPRRVMIRTLPRSSRACIRYPSNLISCSQSGPSGAFSTSLASCGLIQAGGEASSVRRRVGIVADIGVAACWSFKFKGRSRRPVERGKDRPVPDKPSIAVLPFQNMSGDSEQDYFADGIVEEIITALSRIRWLFVIARNSSFTYKG